MLLVAEPFDESDNSTRMNGFALRRATIAEMFG